MKRVTITVSDAVARKLITLACTGRVSGECGYKAFQLMTEHARPYKLNGERREIIIDGVTYVPPFSLSYGRRR